MTLSEFKAWFEGFTESMDGPPSQKAWERIQARVKEITGTPISYPVYVDRYVHPYRRWLDAPYVAYNTASGAQAAYCANNAAATGLFKHAGGPEDVADVAFDGHAAMFAAGKADAALLS